MTDRTIVGKQTLANFHGIAVLGQFGNRSFTVLSVYRPIFLLSLGDLCFPLIGGSPAKQALVVAQSRVEGQVTEGENTGGEEQVKPPLGQWVIVFLNAIKGMAHGAVGFGIGCLALAGCPEQPPAAEHGTEHDHTDPDAPKGTHSFFSVFSCSSVRFSTSSSSKGR